VNCKEIVGLGLTGPENDYHRLAYKYPKDRVERLLPGYLSMSLDSSFRDDIRKASASKTVFPDILLKMLDDLHDPEDRKLAGSWLCESCVQKILERECYLRLVNWMKSENRVFKTNCPRGWDCLGQTAGGHGAEFNHLCEPQAGAKI